MSRRHSLGRAFRWADQGEEQWRRACSYVHKIFDVHVDAAIRKHEAQANEDDGLDNNQPVEKHHSPISMLHSLVQLTHDRVFLRDQLLNVFLGAKDTATIGISDIFFHLARHPDVWRKLRAEVMASTVPGQSLTFNDVKALHYLQNVLKESLRLLSPVDLMSRVCTKDTILPRGGGPNGDASLFVSKGTRIEGRLAPMHRDKKYWGDDAEDFIPERWEQWEGKTGAGKLEDAKVDVVVAELVEDEVLTSESKPKYSRPPRWEYIPFLGGGRMCPARQMTLTQYALLLVHFAQRFARIENRDNEIEFIEQIKFGKQSANGVLVGLIRDK
jgi:cytochrome P450